MIRASIFFNTLFFIFSFLLISVSSFQAVAQGVTASRVISRETQSLTSSLENTQDRSSQKGEISKTAGDFHLWASANIYRLRDNFSIVRQKGNEQTGAFGLDYKITPMLKGGVYYLYGRAHLQSPINKATYRSTLNSIYPYASYNFTNWLFLNVVAGYSNIPTKIRRFNLPRTTPIFAKSKANSWSAIPSLNASFTKEDIGALFQLGYTYEQFKVKRYVESNQNVVRGVKRTRNNIFLFSDVSFYVDGNRAIIPYLQAGGNYDVQATPLRTTGGATRKRAKEGYLAGAGVRSYYFKDTTFGLGWQHIGGHSGLSTDIYSLLLIMAF